MATHTAGMTEIPLGGATSPKPVVDLEWQSFPSQAAATAPASPPAAATPQPTSIPVEPGVPVPLPPTGELEAGFSLLSFFNPAFYVALFDVDTPQVLSRLQAAAWPMQATPLPFLHLLGGKPDLYGPVWIALTLSFVVGASSNMSSWITSHFSASNAPASGSGVMVWQYDFRMLTGALAYVYGYSLGAPLVLWAVLNYLSVSGLGLLSAVCMYGYAIGVFVPVALLCVLPITSLQWLSTLAASLLASLFIFKNTAPILRDQAPLSGGRTVMLLLIAAQLAFGIGLKLLFY